MPFHMDSCADQLKGIYGMAAQIENNTNEENNQKLPNPKLN